VTAGGEAGCGTAPTIYCGELRSSAPRSAGLQRKRKKKKENPKQKKKQHRAGTKGLFTHQHFEFWQVFFSFFFCCFFFKITFLSLTPTSPQKKKNQMSFPASSRHPVA